MQQKADLYSQQYSKPDIYSQSYGKVLADSNNNSSTCKVLESLTKASTVTETPPKQSRAIRGSPGTPIYR